ncbi:MAG TPA: hypothetical protein VEZ15_08555, partial [Acidimicrobiia bacterium]|nr:hypothetical protein [Acidimicrobiia bacterium]
MPADGIDRRTLLRFGGYTALGAAAAYALVACGDGSARTAAPSPTRAPASPPLVDTAAPWWLRGD